MALLERPAGKRRHVGAGIGIMHVAVGLVAGGVGGMLLGGIVGATVRTDRWVPVFDGRESTEGHDRRVELGISLRGLTGRNR